MGSIWLTFKLWRNVPFDIAEQNKTAQKKTRYVRFAIYALVIEQRYALRKHEFIKNFYW